MPDNGNNSGTKKATKTTKWYTIEEVAKHTDPHSVWIVVNGNVLDVTRFLVEHPGGQDVLLSYAGKDASDVFESAHSNKAKELAKSFIIGKLAPKQKNTSAKH